MREKSVHIKSLIKDNENTAVLIYSDPFKKTKHVSCKLHESLKVLKDGTDFSIRVESLRVSLYHCKHFKDEMPAIMVRNTIFIKSLDIPQVFQIVQKEEALNLKYQIIQDSAIET